MNKLQLRSQRSQHAKSFPAIARPSRIIFTSPLPVIKYIYMYYHEICSAWDHPPKKHFFAFDVNFEVPNPLSRRFPPLTREQPRISTNIHEHQRHSHPSSCQKSPPQPTDLTRSQRWPFRIIDTWELNE